MFEKHSNIEFHENPSGGSRVHLDVRTDGRTDRQTESYDEANNHFSKFRQRA